MTDLWQTHGRPMGEAWEAWASINSRNLWATHQPTLETHWKPMCNPLEIHEPPISDSWASTTNPRQTRGRGKNYAVAEAHE